MNLMRVCGSQQRCSEQCKCNVISFETLSTENKHCTSKAENEINTVAVYFPRLFGL